MLSMFKRKPLNPDDVVKRDIQLPRGQQKLAFVLDNVYTKKECEEFIRLTEKKGYETAEINIGGGRQVLMTDIRNSSRCIWDSHEEAGKMFDRIKAYIPETWQGHKVIGLNERLRFLRYDPGEYFKPHYDGQYRRDNGERSFITVHLYLNEGYEGGCTTFIDPQFKSKDETEQDPSQNAAVVPKTGSVLIFEHPIYHEGSILQKGRKYTVRTDVMYTAGKVV